MPAIIRPPGAKQLNRDWLVIEGNRNQRTHEWGDGKASARSGGSEKSQRGEYTWIVAHRSRIAAVRAPRIPQSVR